MSQQQKIILVNDSRLLRSILKQAIQQDLGLRVIAEVDKIEKFNAVIEQTDVDWIVLAQHSEEPIPTIINQVLSERPDINLMVVATDGSRVRTRWIETHDTNLDKKNLQEILAILRQKRSPHEVVSPRI
jgi:DNA-binding NarL/FixJ family response regulator